MRARFWLHGQKFCKKRAARWAFCTRAQSVRIQSQKIHKFRRRALQSGAIFTIMKKNQAAFRNGSRAVLPGGAAKDGFRSKSIIK